MGRFVLKFQGRPWPDGARALHVYALPDLDFDRELAQLAETCRERRCGSNWPAQSSPCAA
ncbi:hypothetical protein [Kitasatospora sp. NPDC057223]|uniref:hypothetical protein n=1 Tax=Kitasatospora sp. NPDC057223 TaxID=3346055 RepID=UPI0036455A74